MKVADRILVITDLFLGALYADATMTGEEDRAAREVLADLLLTSPDALPPHVDDRIRSFSILSFDLEQAAKDFLSDPPMRKRRLLELVALVTRANNTFDLSEDAYLRELGQVLGMDETEYADLVVDYEIEELRQSFMDLRISEVPEPPQELLERQKRAGATEPPPIPEEARRGS